MKKLLISIALISFVSFAFSQSPLPKGQKQFNVGVGFSGWGVPVYAGMDFGVHKDISLGFELSYRSYGENWSGYKYRHTIFGLSGNGNYHFNSLLSIPSNWDFYAGLNLGFYFWNTSGDYAYKGDGSSGLGLGAQVGGRYYFNDKFGLNLEFGGGNAFNGGKFGVSIKF